MTLLSVGGKLILTMCQSDSSLTPRTAHPPGAGQGGRGGDHHQGHVRQHVPAGGGGGVPRRVVGGEGPVPGPDLSPPGRQAGARLARPHPVLGARRGRGRRLAGL